MASYNTVLDGTPSVVREQLSLWTVERHGMRFTPSLRGARRRDVLVGLLQQNLDFKGEDTSYSRHNFHAFAAKFPPPLPKFFIEHLSAEGEIVLDPMMGSGTAILETVLAKRRAVGFDLDPLAVRLCKIKTLDIHPEDAFLEGREVAQCARRLLQDTNSLHNELVSVFDSATKAFLDNWFLPSTQRELLALCKSIQLVKDPDVRAFLDLSLSAIIVTKSGGVSLATDLAHSRPHKVANKVPKNAVDEFEKRVRKNAAGLEGMPQSAAVQLHCADARELPLADSTVDLIVTSPPYANAIDYVRAHKFSLVWFGVPIKSLTELRAAYIGTERAGKEPPRGFGPVSSGVLARLSTKDPKKSRILSRYFRDMAQVFREMLRVTKPKRCAVVVVGSSTMRGIDVRTADGLKEVAQAVGWDVVGVGIRRLDRDKRMMPMRASRVAQSGIEERMSEEAVIGLFKSS